ncbi:ATP-citrate synthase beta chain protein [Sarracenia purpurea var. burkii]
MSNELYNTIARVTDGIYEGIAIGGDVFPGSTLSDHVLRFNNIPQCWVFPPIGARSEVAEALVGEIREEAAAKKLLEPPAVRTSRNRKVKSGEVTGATQESGDFLVSFHQGRRRGSRGSDRRRLKRGNERRRRWWRTRRSATSPTGRLRSDGGNRRYNARTVCRGLGSVFGAKLKTPAFLHSEFFLGRKVSKRRRRHMWKAYN